MGDTHKGGVVVVLFDLCRNSSHNPQHSLDILMGVHLDRKTQECVEI